MLNICAKNVKKTWKNTSRTRDNYSTFKISAYKNLVILRKTPLFSTKKVHLLNHLFTFKKQRIYLLLSTFSHYPHITTITTTKY
jgi:hypothetical protein